jgi:hypothetical protein
MFNTFFNVVSFTSLHLYQRTLVFWYFIHVQYLFQYCFFHIITSIPMNIKTCIMI